MFLYCKGSFSSKHKKTGEISRNAIFINLFLQNFRLLCAYFITSVSSWGTTLPSSSQRGVCGRPQQGPLQAALASPASLLMPVLCPNPTLLGRCLGRGPSILCSAGSPELEEHCLRCLPQEKRLPWPSTLGKRCLRHSRRPLAMLSQPWELPGQGPLSTWLSPDWLAHQGALWEMMVWPWSGLLSTWTLIDNLHPEFWKYCRKSIRFHPRSHGSWFLLPASLMLVLFHSHFWIFFHPSR